MGVGHRGTTGDFEKLIGRVPIYVKRAQKKDILYDRVENFTLFAIFFVYYYNYSQDLTEILTFRTGLCQQAQTQRRGVAKYDHKWKGLRPQISTRNWSHVSKYGPETAVTCQNIDQKIEVTCQNMEQKLKSRVKIWTKNWSHVSNMDRKLKSRVKIWTKNWSHVSKYDNNREGSWWGVRFCVIFNFKYLVGIRDSTILKKSLQN